MEQTVEKVKAELEVIAKKLSLPLENPKVILEWCKNNSYTKKRAAVRYQLGIAKRHINTRRQTTHSYIAGRLCLVYLLNIWRF